MGLLLTVPLTALVKRIADSCPAVIHLSNLLTKDPRPMRRSARIGEYAIQRGKPFEYLERITICRGVMRVFRLITMVWLLFKTTCRDWLEDNATSQGAALAFYAVISLAPLDRKSTRLNSSHPS